LVEELKSQETSKQTGKACNAAYYDDHIT